MPKREPLYPHVPKSKARVGGEIRYSAEIVEENGLIGTLQLRANTDTSARAEMQRQFPALRTEYPTARLYLAFFRQSDSQHGYINRNGASPVGKAW